MPRRVVRRSPRLLVLAGAAGVSGLALLLSGCSDSSLSVDPSGVDGLVVPTPSPDPADFVTRVDNPWLPLASGTSWIYSIGTRSGLGGPDGSGQPDAGTGAVRTVQVQDGRVLVDGVQTTAVTRSPSTGSPATGAPVTDYYAQDRAGNVWWFGQSGNGAASWRAGVDGARAGLAMAADPRRGDGYRGAYLPGTVDRRVLVLATDETTSTPTRTYADVVAVRSTNGLDGSVRTDYYAPGVGLVRVDSRGSLTAQVLLEMDSRLAAGD